MVVQALMTISSLSLTDKMLTLTILTDHTHTYSKQIYMYSLIAL